MMDRVYIPPLDKIDDIYRDIIIHEIISFKGKVKKDIDDMFDTEQCIMDYEIRFIFILSQIIIFENQPIVNVIETYTQMFKSVISQQHIIKCIKYIEKNFTDELDYYKKLNTTISFYKSALGYDTVDLSVKMVEYSVKGYNYQRMIVDKINKKHVQSNSDLLKILINEYKILSTEKLVDTSDLLLELLQNSGKRK